MMPIRIRTISDGFFKRDAGQMLGTPKVEWETKVRVDRDNRMALGLNSLLICHGDKNILVDPGVGCKETSGRRNAYGLQPSKLGKGLRDLGLAPKDIHIVILTHLHFGHSGGCTRMDRAGNLVLAFPRATYYVQRSAWEEAQHPNERSREAYDPDDFAPLEEEDALVLLDGDAEVFPGVYCMMTNGHTKGHQVVLVHHGGERIAFLGDIVPTPHHLDMGCISTLDRLPEETLEVKRHLLRQAEKDGWLLVFYHGRETTAGYLERVNSHTALRPVAF